MHVFVCVFMWRGASCLFAFVFVDVLVCGCACVCGGAPARGCDTCGPVLRGGVEFVGFMGHAGCFSFLIETWTTVVHRRLPLLYHNGIDMFHTVMEMADEIHTWSMRTLCV